MNNNRVMKLRENRKTSRNSVIYSAYLIILLVCVGCDADLLNTHPDDRYTVGNFWEGSEAVNAALTGTYRALRYQGVVGRQASPEWEDAAKAKLFTTSGIGFGNIALGQQSATSGSVMSWRWSHSSDGVGRANSCLSRIDEATGISEEGNSRTTGAAL